MAQHTRTSRRSGEGAPAETTAVVTRRRRTWLRAWRHGADPDAIYCDLREHGMKPDKAARLVGELLTSPPEGPGEAGIGGHVRRAVDAVDPDPAGAGRRRVRLVRAELHLAAGGGLDETSRALCAQIAPAALPPRRREALWPAVCAALILVGAAIAARAYLAFSP